MTKKNTSALRSRTPAVDCVQIVAKGTSREWFRHGLDFYGFTSQMLSRVEPGIDHSRPKMSFPEEISMKQMARCPIVRSHGVRGVSPKSVMSNLADLALFGLVLCSLFRNVRRTCWH